MYGRRVPASLPVLLLEDDAPVARAMGRIFQPYFRLLFAEKLKTALELLREDERLRGAVVDVALPDGSGLEFVAAIRAQDLTMPVLVLTGHHETDIANAAHRMNAEYLCKPPPGDNLRAFGRRMISSVLLGEHRAKPHLEEFARQSDLTLRETEIVARALVDESREEMALRMGVAICTLKTEIRSILGKCGEPSLGEVAWNLRAAARPKEAVP